MVRRAAVHVRELLVEWRPILIAYVSVAAGRALVVLLASALLAKTREAIPWQVRVFASLVPRLSNSRIHRRRRGAFGMVTLPPCPACGRRDFILEGPEHA